MINIQSNANFHDFPIGTQVKVVCLCQDMMFFKGNETGMVIRNSGEYLGIIVEFDKPIKFKDDPSVLKSFNFKPTDLYPIGRVPDDLRKKLEIEAAEYRKEQYGSTIRDIVIAEKDEIEEAKKLIENGVKLNNV